MKETTKNKARQLLRPLVALLARAGVSPSAVTVTALPLSVAAAWAFAAGRFVLAGILVALVGLCDSVDGELSRRTGRASPAGAFLDSNVDRISEALVLCGLAWHYMPVSRAYAMLSILAMVFSLLVSYVRARAEGVGRECKVGFFERPIRVVVLLLGTFVPLRPAMPVALGIIAAGSLETVVHRLVHVLRQRPGER
jgi:CDP-diacylglycerol--glycerol-3-phosphate 3-phosphatidyltransferase